MNIYIYIYNVQYKYDTLYDLHRMTFTVGTGAPIRAPGVRVGSSCTYVSI